MTDDFCSKMSKSTGLVNLRKTKYIKKGLPAYNLLISAVEPSVKLVIL